MAKKKTKKIQARSTKQRKKKIPDLVFPEKFWTRHQLVAILLFLLPFALYIQTVKYQYVLDDIVVFTENAQVKKGISGISDILTTESMTGYFDEQKSLLAGARYRPLSLVTFAIEQQLFGRHNFMMGDYFYKEIKKVPALAANIDQLKSDADYLKTVFPDEQTFLQALERHIPPATIEQHRETILFHAAHGNPAISHFINILLYALSALLLFRILFLLFPSDAKNEYFSIPFIATLLFILHPIHTEVVANVKGRDEIMAVLGSLAALYYALKYVANEKRTYLVASGAILFLSIMSKENALTFVAVIPLTIYFFTKTSMRKIAITTAPLVIIFVVYLLWRNHVIGYLLEDVAPTTDIMNNPFADMNASQRIATIMYTLGLYVKLLFIPTPLTHDYYPYHIPIMNWGKIGSILSLLLYAGLGVYALLGIKKKSVIAYAILFYLATLSIVSNIPFSVGTFMNERFIYLPSIGFCIALAYWVVKKLPAPILNIGVLSLFLFGFLIKTITRIPVWENGYTLNASAIKYSPNSARANCFIGVALFENDYRKETDPTRKKTLIEEIDVYIDKAIEINPKYQSALTMKGGVAAEIYKMDGDLDKMLQAFETVIKVKKRDNFVDTYLDYIRGRDDAQSQINFYHRIGYDYFTTQAIDYNLAVLYLKMGLQVDPNNVLLNQDLAKVNQLRGG